MFVKFIMLQISSKQKKRRILPYTLPLSFEVYSLDSFLQMVCHAYVCTSPQYCQLPSSFLHTGLSRRSKIKTNLKDFFFSLFIFILPTALSEKHLPPYEVPSFQLQISALSFHYCHSLILASFVVLTTDYLLKLFSCCVLL